MPATEEGVTTIGPDDPVWWAQVQEAALKDDRDVAALNLIALALGNPVPGAQELLIELRRVQ